MTTYTSICSLCSKRIEANSQLILFCLENEHIRLKHPEIFEHNRKVAEKYRQLIKKAEDYKIFNEKLIFKRLGEENP